MSLQKRPRKQQNRVCRVGFSVSSLRSKYSWAFCGPVQWSTEGKDTFHLSYGVIANFKSDLCILKVMCILISFAGLES